VHQRADPRAHAQSAAVRRLLVKGPITNDESAYCRQTVLLQFSARPPSPHGRLGLHFPLAFSSKQSDESWCAKRARY
jgi:hypothetical protein